MAKFRVEFRDEDKAREIEAHTFAEMKGSYVFVDGRNKTVAAIPLDLVRLVTQVED